MHKFDINDFVNIWNNRYDFVGFLIDCDGRKSKTIAVEVFEVYCIEYTNAEKNNLQPALIFYENYFWSKMVLFSGSSEELSGIRFSELLTDNSLNKKFLRINPANITNNIIQIT